MKDLVDKNYIYGEIKLWKTAKNKEDIGVLVEAKPDELFFRKFFNKQTTFFTTNGVYKLFEVIDELEEHNEDGIIGIIDADFRNIDNDNINKNNIFITDKHDVEMMMITSEVWENVIDYFVDRKKILEFEKEKNKTLKEHIFELSRQIACVRYLKKIEDLDLKFRIFKSNKPDFIDYHKFISKKELTIDKSKMIEVIENKSSKNNLFKNNSELTKKLETICSLSFDLSQFCNGHDFMNILAYSFKSAVSNKNISGIELEKYFIVSYRKEDFEKTNLYSSIVGWEKKNNNFSVF